MPTISMFYGIVVMMFFRDNKQHNSPHIHIRYQDDKAVVGIPDAELIDSTLPKKQMRMVQAWVEIHRDELMADWDLAIAGDQIYKIDPLK